jgi:hypothetical protein
MTGIDIWQLSDLPYQDWRHWPYRTRGSSIICCSAPVRKLFSKSLAIRDTSDLAPQSSRASPHRTFPQLNLHRARARRKPRAASFKRLYRTRAEHRARLAKLAAKSFVGFALDAERQDGEKKDFTHEQKVGHSALEGLPDGLSGIYRMDRRTS